MIDGREQSPMQHPEVLANREQFYEPVDLKTDLTCCGDERPVIGIGESQTLVSIFGGPGANVAWNVMVLQEIAKPDSATTTFADVTSEITKQLVESSIKTTVHSDDHTEHADTIDLSKNPDGDIGCGYLKLRQTISQVIGERGDEIVSILVREKPELYANKQSLLRKVIEANTALANRNEIFTSGRDVAQKAVDEGAQTIVVTGDHVAKVGILNLEKNASFDTKSAMSADLPAYNHNTWAAIDSYKEVQNEYGFELVDFEASNDVDAVGTMLALGVEEIYIRKP